jgi:hypothetical protein
MNAAPTDRLASGRERRARLDGDGGAAIAASEQQLRAWSGSHRQGLSTGELRRLVAAFLQPA